jgi:dTDP-4-amino-4,6-dideoxygalactose transaminase
MLWDFEEAFADFCGTDHCIGVANGTDALKFALVSAGVITGDVVITAPNSFIATAEAISQVGALPEFVDVDERTSNIDPASLRIYLNERCRRGPSGRLISNRSNRPVTAIIPVHLYGHMADLDAIEALAEEFALLLIEDACQAHGARYFSQKDKKWKRAGTVGKAAAFSFYPGKNLGACGEAGAVTTNDEAAARCVRMLRDHGQSQKYQHQIEGHNGRLDAIQAGILSIKLPYLEQWNAQRRQNAQRYNQLLSSLQELTVPYEAEQAESVYHLYVVRTPSRAALMAHLSKLKIGTGIHYPVPLHLQTAYKYLGYRPGDFPIAEKLATEILSLPVYPGLTIEQQEFVAGAIAQFLESVSADVQVMAVT